MGQRTAAFRTCHQFQCRLADYPVLDEHDYSAAGRRSDPGEPLRCRLSGKAGLRFAHGRDVGSLPLALGPRAEDESRTVYDRGGALFQGIAPSRAFTALGYKRIQRTGTRQGIELCEKSKCLVTLQVDECGPMKIDRSTMQDAACGRQSRRPARPAQRLARLGCSRRFVDLIYRRCALRGGRGR